jgi:hypothetical protein
LSELFFFLLFFFFPVLYSFQNFFLKKRKKRERKEKKGIREKEKERIIFAESYLFKERVIFLPPFFYPNFFSIFEVRGN